MAGQTLNRAYPFPTGTDANDVPYRMQALAEAIDADVQSVASQTLNAKFTITSSFSVPNAFVTLPWTVKSGTNAGLFTLANGVVTVTEGGLYIINTHVVWGFVSNSNLGRRLTAVTINGTETVNTVSSATIAAVTNGETVVETMKTIRLNAGDNVRTRLFQDSGTTISVTPGTPTNYLGQTILELTRLSR